MYIYVIKANTDLVIRSSFDLKLKSHAMRVTIPKYHYKRSAPIVVEHTSICTGTLIKNAAKTPLIHEVQNA